MRPCIVAFVVLAVILCAVPAWAIEGEDPAPAVGTDPVYDPAPEEPRLAGGELVVLDPFGGKPVLGYRYGLYTFGKPIEVKAADELLQGFISNLRLDLYVAGGIQAGVSSELWTDAFGPVDVGLAITTLSPYGAALVWDAGFWELLELAGEPLSLSLAGAAPQELTLGLSWQKAW